jgi:cellulose synthase/poly-beta-1,6-N-acetylglucosamine synthase-like glycosyltransferase
MSLEYLSSLALAAYLVVLSLVCIYGAHRYFLVALYYRYGRKGRSCSRQFADLPPVTVQLPMFNERYVAQRIIEQACRIEYPRDRLEIQVLDDSIDDTQTIARAAVERMRAAGHNVVYLHRDNRVGYKAGALEAGLKTARGEYIAIFDADFLPPERILLDTIHYFADPAIGMVQTRWAHLNRDVSVLTQAQAVLLDGHFMIEHTARNRSGRFMSFNGTGGVWRKTAISDAGGWQHDTLTEDLDLSYRAQLRGWKFVFLPDLTSPAELPPEMTAFKAQQHRWTKGGTQTCLKLLPRVLRSDTGWWVKTEAFFHLTSFVVYILIVLLSLLLGPALYAKLILTKDPPWLVDLESVLFVVGFGAPLIFYIISQRVLRYGWFRCIKYIPALMAVGVGIAFNNAIAAVEGLFGQTGEFVRTPKFGEEARRTGNWRNRLAGFRHRRSWQVWAELAIALYLTACMVGFFFFDNWFQRVSAAIPFMLIFIGGYFYVSLETLYTQWHATRNAPVAPAAVGAGGTGFTDSSAAGGTAALRR